MTLSFANSSTGGNVFVTIFIIVWVGGLVITINAQALGSNVSIFQSICLLGYCLFPIDLAALIIKICTFLPIYVKFVICMVAFLWSSMCILICKLASIGFMSQLIQNDKKMLATYPIFLFYLFLAWFVINSK